MNPDGNEEVDDKSLLLGRITLKLLACDEGIHVEIEEDGDHDMTPLEMFGVLEMAKASIYYEMFIADEYDPDDEVNRED